MDLISHDIIRIDKVIRNTQDGWTFDFDKFCRLESALVTELKVMKIVLGHAGM